MEALDKIVDIMLTRIGDCQTKYMKREDSKVASWDAAAMLVSANVFVLVSISLLSIINDKYWIKDTFAGMPKTDFPPHSSKTRITIVFSIVSNPWHHQKVGFVNYKYRWYHIP
jgi:hypothetical protein